MCLHLPDPALQVHLVDKEITLLSTDLMSSNWNLKISNLHFYKLNNTILCLTSCGFPLRSLVCKHNATIFIEVLVNSIQ